ncbi:MAG: hypothetical protein OXM61_16745 [Candidatus Poribacteria bacterium]|nr:hypothetical protein [Candidatus Poribacteria bacterium]
MAVIELTATEIISVRRLISTRLTPELFPDSYITDVQFLESSADYVFETVISDMDLEKLTTSERMVAERVRDQNPEDVAMFINNVLKPPQQKQFRRAVVFNLAGQLIPSVSSVVSESAGGISQSYLWQPSEQRQAFLFSEADREIDRLRNAFPDDAFPDTEGPAVENPYANLNLVRLTDST